MDDERQKCCSGIREPSGRYPWSLWLHCISGSHIRMMYGRDDFGYIHPELAWVFGVLVCGREEVALKIGVDGYVDRIIEQRVREGW